ncbi:hypothetical protein HDV06_001804 [Boothiomyces sp. JEL0866]|nr:hypothetical protein HDV06_001804 [Boothiomyces sp. JEL0866]
MNAPVFLVQDRYYLYNHQSHEARIIENNKVQGASFLLLRAENNSFIIRSISNNMNMAVNDNGRCVFEQDVNPRQLFQFIFVDGGVHIKSTFNDKFVVIVQDEVFCIVQSPVLWNIVSSPVCFKAYNGNIMQNIFFWNTAEALNRNMKEFEQMEIKLCEKGYQIQSRWNNRFLHVKDNGKCVFKPKDNSLNQIFDIITDDKGITRIRSMLNKCWMYCNAADGKIWCLNDEPDERCEWGLVFLEMNDMFNSNGLQRAAIIGAGVVGCTVAAPFVLIGVLAAVGFGASGPVAGSIAAGIQSYIGSVAAGSTFAACQSIGMAGLSAGATAVTSAVGAGVGVGIGLGVNERVRVLNDTGNNDQ